MSTQSCVYEFYTIEIDQQIRALRHRPLTAQMRSGRQQTGNAVKDLHERMTIGRVHLNGKKMISSYVTMRLEHDAFVRKAALSKMAADFRRRNNVAKELQGWRERKDQEAGTGLSIVLMMMVTLERWQCEHATILKTAPLSCQRVVEINRRESKQAYRGLEHTIM